MSRFTMHGKVTVEEPGSNGRRVKLSELATTDLPATLDEVQIDLEGASIAEAIGAMVPHADNYPSCLHIVFNLGADPLLDALPGSRPLKMRMAADLIQKAVSDAKTPATGERSFFAVFRDKMRAETAGKSPDTKINLTVRIGNETHKLETFVSQIPQARSKKEDNSD